MIDFRSIILYLVIFLLGFAAASISISTLDAEYPLAEMITGYTAGEQPSPHDWIAEKEISVTQAGVCFKLENPQWARFTDTNSMDPVLDAGTNAIEITPEQPEDLHVGDIVSYNSKYSSGTIIHRVVEIGEDEDGWYARMKGDNNPGMDPGKVRFSQVQRIVVALIY